MFYNIFSDNVINYTFLQRIKYFILSFVLYFFFAIISVIIIHLTDYFITDILNQPSISEAFALSRKRIDKYSLFTIIIITPFIEELLFRLPLVINKINISVFIGTLFFITIYKTSLFQLSINFILTFFFFFMVLFFYNKFNVYIKFINNNIKLVIIMSILFFGLIHILNLDNINIKIIPLYVIYILPQIFMGYFITNLRIKLGFIWGVLLHALINLIGSLSLIFN